MFDTPLSDFEHLPTAPHGGRLINRVVSASTLADQVALARGLPALRIDLEAAITIEMIATGVLSPIEGFMNSEDYTSVLDHGRLADGTVWPVPLSFAPTGARNSEVLAGLSIGDEVALVDDQDDPIAIVTVEDLFDYNKDERAEKLFGTTDRAHPGVDAIHRRMGEVSIGGPIRLLRRVDWGPFEKLRQEPVDTWRMFYEEKGFTSVAGFITGANPLHRGHEYIHRNALEDIDGLLLQPLVEMAKREYVRHEFRMLAYRNVLEEYYPEGRAFLSPLRVTYIFAGPRETVLHALIMKNFGCTHALIGRDHAGIGDYYDKYASHTIFEEFTPEQLGIEVRLFHEVFYCARCSAHATTETCPHDETYRLNISGTGIREMLRHGIVPPKEIVRPESAMAAIQGVQPKGLDEHGAATEPVGRVIDSLFPYYRRNVRLGGPERVQPLEDLTNADLELAVRDARSHATEVYADVYNEYAKVLDHNRAVHRPWVEEAQRALIRQQDRVISDLEEKVEQAPEASSDEFMYQDGAEARRELEAARSLRADAPIPVSGEALAERVWNPLPYARFRSGAE